MVYVLEKHRARLKDQAVIPDPLQPRVVFLRMGFWCLEGDFRTGQGWILRNCYWTSHSFTSSFIHSLTHPSDMLRLPWETTGLWYPKQEFPVG